MNTPPAQPHEQPPHQPRPQYGPPPGYQQGPPPGYQQPPPGYGQPPKPGTNGFAIAALVLGIIGGAVLSVIFGLVALSQIRRTGQSGRGMAIAGLVLSGVWLLAIAVAASVAIVSSASRDTGGQITSGGSVSATSVQVGDCLGTLADATRVTSLSAVPCAQPHEGEVFAVFDLPPGDYPGVTAVTEQVESQCTERFAGYAPAAAQDPSLGLYYLYPFEQNWRAGDREAVCIATTTTPRTGSLRQR